MNVALYTQKDDQETLLYIDKFIKELEKRSVHAVVYYKNATSVPQLKTIDVFTNKEELKTKNIELFFTFGGDGTIVNSLLFVGDSQIPVVGVNTGRLGFLTGFSKDDIFEHLDSILNKECILSKRSVIEVMANNSEQFFPFALNDVTLSRKETTSMITVDSFVNDEFLNIFWGDGVIVSTPTGSTAYSLSCGGPIISPDNGNFVITPIAPHNLNVRPLVINDGVEIRLKVSSRVPQYSLSLDSRIIHIDTDIEIRIKKADFSIFLLLPKTGSFFETIRQKLLWGKDKRN